MDSGMEKYLSSLSRKIFKILPMFEDKEPTLSTYINSLKIEMMGYMAINPEVKENECYQTALSIIGYLENGEYDMRLCKREVFKAKNIIDSMVNGGSDG